MKLEWKRAGFAAVADCNGMTANVWFNGADWNFQVYSQQGIHVSQTVAPTCNTRIKAEQLAEQWLEENDKPAWNDATPWLSWAEWRGIKMLVRPYSRGECDFQWQISSKKMDDCGTRSLETMQQAKDACEQFVRQMTAKGESC